MREIKFRALSDTNKWIYSDELGESPFWELLTSPSLLKKETLGQFTGLKDKNGKEIYEGDIIKSDSNVMCSCPDCKKGSHPDKSVGQVLIVRGASKIKFKESVQYDDDDDGWYSIDDSEHYKIIGNIYENKELLK